MSHLAMPRKNFSGALDRYVFKSRLHEYAQKVGLPKPVYEIIKEGPDHKPLFKSTVIVNGVRYRSLTRFFTRKDAEHSAAEVALLELSKPAEVSDVNESPSQRVLESGLCKSLLQEHALKTNYALPVYKCQMHEAPGRVPHFTCTVEFGGIQHRGGRARTKKEAEINAARSALLAQTNKPVAKSQLTVISYQKRGMERRSNHVETENVPKNAQFGKKAKLSRNVVGHSQARSRGKSSVSQERLQLAPAKFHDVWTHFGGRGRKLRRTEADQGYEPGSGGGDDNNESLVESEDDEEEVM